MPNLHLYGCTLDSIVSYIGWLIDISPPIDLQGSAPTKKEDVRLKTYTYIEAEILKKKQLGMRQKIVLFFKGLGA
jgi:hypothetical protein